MSGYCERPNQNDRYKLGARKTCIQYCSSYPKVYCDWLTECEGLRGFQTNNIVHMVSRSFRLVHNFRACGGSAGFKRCEDFKRYKGFKRCKDFKRYKGFKRCEGFKRCKGFKRCEGCKGFKHCEGFSWWIIKLLENSERLMPLISLLIMYSLNDGSVMGLLQIIANINSKQLYKL